MVGPTDPAWEPRDREWALAWQQVEAARCKACGTFHDEWEADRFAYVADTWVCPGCENLENERKNDPNKDHGGTAGLKTYLVPRAVAEAAEAAEAAEGAAA